MILVVNGCCSHTGRGGKPVILKTEEAEKLMETVKASEPEMH